MKRILISLVFTLSLVLSATAFAVKGEHAHYVYSLTSGHPGQIRMALTQIIKARIFDTELMDVVMEVLLLNASNSDSFLETLGYAFEALRYSRNSRYYTALMSIADDEMVHKELRKRARSSANKLGEPEGTEQYAARMVDLNKVKIEADAAWEELTKNLKGADGYESIGVVDPGMTAAEVITHCGQPTAITSPNKSKELSHYLYKGQGTIVIRNYSNWTSGRYSTHVMEVEINENEQGYRK
jgi:hypothetical protein